MKSVMISIKPKWCELIASGKKTVEVRKTRPKCDMPFKCYIYETQGRYDDMKECKTFKFWESRQKVIGEFVCDNIFQMSVTYSDPNSCVGQKEFPYTCLTDKQIIDYLGNGKQGYGWHISDLVIYDKPKDLCDFMAFGKDCCDRKNCEKCLYLGIDNVCDIENIEQPLFRPPQSWGYVEEVEQ